jgi:hypothetical protein
MAQQQPTGDTLMFTNTKIALAAAVVLGFAGASAASDNNSGDYHGGFAIPGSTYGVNPVHHPGWFGKARSSGRANKAFGYTPVRSNKHMARHYDNSDWAPVYATPSGTSCPTLEGYPDCH